MLNMRVRKKHGIKLDKKKAKYKYAESIIYEPYSGKYSSYLSI